MLEDIKRNRFPYILALVHFIITFFTDRLIFTVPVLSSPFNYIVCKIFLLFILILCYRALFLHSPDTIKILKYAAIYLLPIIAVLIFKLPEGFLSNDEALIFEEAIALHDYTWFNYLTTYYYIISMMLIPSWLGPILVKVVIQLLVAGYSVYRISDYLNFKYGKFLYLPFFLPPVLAYTTSAHRIPVYFLIYLFLLFSLFMDGLEKKGISKGKLLWVLFLGAILTQWRTEGIYFLGLLPILLLITYPAVRNRRAFLSILLCYIFLQYAVSVPQNGLIPNRMGDEANNRMGPFYAYTVTNMFRNGLDRRKNAADIEKINRYLDISIIDSINEDLKDINYEDVLILYYPGYIGIRSEADGEDYLAYTEGCKSLFINNPDVFMKTRAGAFHYAATPYSIEYKEGGLKGFLLFAVSIVKTISYNLYAPCLLLILLLIISLIKKRFFLFFMSGGLCCHFLIVFLLAPASYFKYYFPIYMTVYFFYIYLIIERVWKTRNK